ncbi:sulfite exporter TauE/SafE family protein [Roseococcus sp. SDR]|uniref:sulfite exporter TauE/SafE family protein n=1 Tax=Roseococcus sp. SDR TaxID=2835532 RepID=UPI001BCE835C|nr:sulfite exporter TauE/SafE family protein [Roseococcus sp. SDR]MBS7792025.1 sulfite exporter TauE/SafE family protein [Roseococcus sp. SDR]MBV1847339.1 sulfite exporter TauE/SafE family protein [Roseococcus sp. SDR]
MWADALLISAGSLLAAFCASIAGFAFVLVGAAVLLQVMAPALVAPVLVMGSLIVQGIGTYAVRDHIPWRRLWLYVGTATLGVPFGLAILALGPARAIVAGVGVLLVVYASYTLARIALRMTPARRAATTATDAAIGFASGILGGIGGYVGALVGMWADVQGMPPQDTRALMQPFIAIMQALTIIGLAFTGFFTAEAIFLTATAVPALLLGTWLGLRAGKHLPAQGFRLVLLGLLLVSGISLLI